MGTARLNVSASFFFFFFLHMKSFKHYHQYIPLQTISEIIVMECGERDCGQELLCTCAVSAVPVKDC